VEFSGTVTRELGGNTIDFPIELSWEVILKQLENLPE
jgi:hypothetical protein